MATRVLLAFAMILLTACSQAVPSSTSEDTASASGDSSNSERADSPNNTRSEDSSDGSTDSVDETDLPPDLPLNTCSGIKLLKAYYTESFYAVKFTLTPIEYNCQMKIDVGGGLFDQRVVHGTGFPLSGGDGTVDIEVDCLEYRHDGVAKTIRMRLYFTGTNEVYYELIVYEPAPPG